MTDVNEKRDGERDQALGAALRGALEAGDARRFVTGVLSGWDAARAPRPAWAHLAAWARVGIAAALLVAALLGAASRGRFEGPPTLDAVLSGADDDEAGVLLAGSSPPDPGWLLAPDTAP